MSEIEDADIVVDLSGGKLVAQKYLKRIKQLKAENEGPKEGRLFSFQGWIIMKCKCVPLGQIWMNPNEPALKGE